jgi:hypothetical protein
METDIETDTGVQPLPLLDENGDINDNLAQEPPVPGWAATPVESIRESI